MNDLVQDKVVEQKDIIKIIEIINGFYKEKKAIFEDTKRAIEEEEKAYAEWRKKKYESTNYANYPEFTVKTHANKLNYENFSFSFHCKDGITYDNKTYAEANKILASGYENVERFSITLDLSWQKTYNKDNYHYSDIDRASINVHITFHEDDIYTNYQCSNADSDINYLKSEISDVFRALKPKYSDLISKRESIKYKSTLCYSFIISAIAVVFLSLNAPEGFINFVGWEYFAFVLISLVVNILMPTTKLNNLYKLIIPPKKTVYENKELKKVDNVKAFRSTAEVHIGINALKSGKREQIEAIAKSSKTANIVCFVIAVVIVTVFVII